MSSILKALKKIEGRKVETRRPAWRNQSGSRQMPDSQINRSRKRQKLLVVLIIICGITIAVKLYPGWRSTSGNGISENRPDSISTTDLTVRKKITAAAESPASPPSPDTATAPPHPSPEAPVAAAPVTAATEPETPAKSAPQTETAKAPMTSPEPPAPGKTETPTTAEPSESRTVETFDPTPANNAGLTLHALVWAENPDERFVVINGDILREGAAIDGVTIVRIERNYVVMKSKAGTWKLR